MVDHESPALVHRLLDEAKSDRAAMEGRLDAKDADLKAALALQRNEIEQQEAKVEAKVKEAEAKMEAKMEEQRKEMEQQQLALRAELSVPPAEPALNDEQLVALQARIEGLHVTKLLTDEELFAIEDMIVDWAEVQASMEGKVITQTALYATQTFGVGVRVHKLLKISEVATGDAAFARQLRRKFL
jgi:chromosome segregation ATPase